MHKITRSHLKNTYRTVIASHVVCGEAIQTKITNENKVLACFVVALLLLATPPKAGGAMTFCAIKQNAPAIAGAFIDQLFPPLTQEYVPSTQNHL